MTSTASSVVLIFGSASVECVPVVVLVLMIIATSSSVPSWMQTYRTARSVTTSVEGVSNATHQGSLLGSCHRREVVL